MPNSPVQVVLNADNFVRARETSPGGSNKDFFAERDDLFAAHKERLIAQIGNAREVLERSDYGGVGFAKVVLRRSALAKSHRPTTVILPPNRVPMVGTDGLGQLIVEVSPESLANISQSVASAEGETRAEINEHTQRREFHPSRRRSEVGAIEQFELWSATDKRRFSASEAVRWLSDERTGGGYRVFLFMLPVPRNEWDAIPIRRRELFRTFVEGLHSLGGGISVEPAGTGSTGPRMISIRMSASTETSIVQLWDAPRLHRRPLAAVDLSVERHERLLQFLDRHPLVRRVELPPRLQHSIAPGRAAEPSGQLEVPRRTPGAYPLVGIIDGGVSPFLGPWVVHRWGLLAPSDRDEDHGTFIGGLLVAGSSMNSHGAVSEPIGCDIVDVDVFPRDGRFAHYYPSGLADFLDEVEQAVADCRARLGVRVFNLSLNADIAANLDRYSSDAGRLDRIADAHDVVFVISGGNLDGALARPEWDADASRALAGLASSRNDTVLVPAESIRNVSVAALNPPGHSVCIPHAPASYSRRGPALRTGVKPDFAHIGGAGVDDPTMGSGLYSCSPSGAIRSGRGTSYAAPQIAKTMAMLDGSIEGSVSRETLVALLVHHSTTPAPLRAPEFSSVARDLCGFGVPNVANEILEGDDHRITLVFASRLVADAELAFDFAWPPSLVGDGGKCRGDVQLTLVASPPLNDAFGAEFVRVNIEAALQQEYGSGFKGRLEAAYLPERGGEHTYEADLIQHALKWSPTKTYQKSMPRGVGTSSRWRLTVSYLTRAAEQMPDAGVPFTVVLTIADPDGEKPVFNELRQSLQAQGVVTADIQTAARISSRV